MIYGSIAHRKLSSVHLEFLKSVTPAQSDNENRFPIVKNLRDKITIKYLGHADRYQ